MDIDNGTLAIIVISVALGVTFIILFICLIIFCRLRLQDDTNIRKRILGRQNMGYMGMDMGMGGQDQIKTEIIEEDIIEPMPYVVPQPMPLPRREIYMEPPTPPPPPPPQPPSHPEIIVHEVVHRYQPTQPSHVILSPPTAPPMPDLPPQRIVRRSSWSAPAQNDEWVMIKKTKKKQRGRRSRDEDSDDSDDSDDDVYTRKRLAHYNLAMPMRMAPMGMGMGMGMGVMGAQPMMAAPMMMAPMAPTMMTTGAASFQPTYGVVPMM
jgi:hypothetical protein